MNTKICSKCLGKHLNFGNILTLVCSLLTLLLISQELYSFLVIKPTTTSKEEKELQPSDLPEIVLCLYPGFDSNVLEKYGYTINKYYRGSMDGKKFVGWNGNQTESKSSEDILEQILVVDKTFQSLLNFVAFSKDHADMFTNADVHFRTLVYPHGRCMSIGLPKPKLANHGINCLSFGINKTFVGLQNLTSTELRVYFMDKTNSVLLYPEDMEMTGDQVKMNLEQEEPEALSFKVQISHNEHVEDDPLLGCDVYTKDNPYSICAQKELFETFKKEIGCVPPILEQDPQKMCNKKFNISIAKDKIVDSLFKPLYFHNRRFGCKSPCTQNIFSSRFVHASPSDNMYMVIVFEKTVKLVRSSFSINGQTLLSRLGGSVSSGRTLLWVFLTILAVFQVSRDYCQYQICHFRLLFFKSTLKSVSHTNITANI